MNEFLDKLSVENRIMNATEVNVQHALELERSTKERRMRSREQNRAELLGNNNIDYQKHMPWLD
ncbi:hypothetical protein [Leuconostoc mesenteroides]